MRYYMEVIMKETAILNKEVETQKVAKTKNPVLEKIGNFLFGVFVTVLFTLPVWCILMIVVYFVNRI